MSTKPPPVAATKLSRKPKKTQGGTQVLNRSGEDFQPSNNCSSNRTSLRSSSNVKSFTKLVEKDESLPACPFCAKPFVLGQEMARAAHMKSCGNQLGVDTEALLKIKRLEDKQAEEWKALGIPQAASVPNRTVVKRAKASKPAKASTDPHLEMALALSASLAVTEQSNGDAKESDVPTVLLPQATSWPPPAAVPRHKTTAKTCLQVRTDSERDGQISGKVAHVLAETEPEHQVGSFLLRSRNYQTIPSTKLLKWSSPNNAPLWQASSLTKNDEETYHIDAFKPYLSKIEPSSAATVQEKDVNNECEKVSERNTNEVEKLSLDLGRLFDSKDRADVIVYTKGEHGIPCHSIILWSRCKAVLTDIIEEVSENGGPSNKIVSWDDISKKTATSVLRFFYTGKLPQTIDSDSQLEEFKVLANRYRLKSLEEHVATFHEQHSFSVGESSQISGGFIDDDEDENDEGGATQNMECFLDIIDENEQEEDDTSKDWDDMCDYLTQKQLNKSSSTSTSPKSRPESPDMFADEAEESAADCSRKRKSIVDGDCDDDDATTPVLKKSRAISPPLSTSFDVTPENGRRHSVYNRRHSSPLFLEELNQQQTPEMANIATECKLPPLHNRVQAVLAEEQQQQQQQQQQATPQPDYESMLSPALRKELRQFGLKVIPRRKAVPLLKHIYEETHPVACRRKVTFPEPPGDKEEESDSEDLLNASQDSSTSGKSDLPEESVLYEDNEDDDDLASQPEEEEEQKKDVAEELIKFIQSDCELHKMCLLYEPIWLEDVFAQFKEASGIKKCKLSQVQDVLDNECITFRTRARQASSGRTQKKPKKVCKNK